MYIDGGSRVQLELDLLAGVFRSEWMSTTSGRVERQQDFKHGGGRKTLDSPDYKEDIALRVKRTD